jgi:mannose-1-phosphate guanylyltransferase/phosphomannomutase
MRAVRLEAEHEEVDALDGVRVVEPDGSWCLVLPQDDEAVLTLFAEASDNAAAERLLDRWQGVVEAVS